MPVPFSATLLPIQWDIKWRWISWPIVGMKPPLSKHIDIYETATLLRNNYCPQFLWLSRLRRRDHGETVPLSLQSSQHSSEAESGIAFSFESKFSWCSYLFIKIFISITLSCLLSSPSCSWRSCGAITRLNWVLPNQLAKEWKWLRPTSCGFNNITIPSSIGSRANNLQRPHNQQLPRLLPQLPGLLRQLPVFTLTTFPLW